jgi:hypothetical protein
VPSDVDDVYSAMRRSGGVELKWQGVNQMRWASGM